MKNNTGLNFTQQIGLEALWLGSRVFASLPYWVKFYVVESLIYVVLRYLIRYRNGVVMQNLHNSFPEKSEREIRRIRNRFYHTLSEVMISTINLTNASHRKLCKMFHVANLEQQQTAVAGRDWIAMTAHYGCWEYCAYWGVYDPAQIVVAVYHPLRSPVMEQFYRRLRNTENSQAVTMKESLLFYLRHREQGLDGKRLVMGLIADQNPPKRPDSHWMQFLNQDTIFFDGGEKLALRCHLPVYFVKMVRERRGCYRFHFEQIYDGVEAVEPYEITERYVTRLESIIRECPELWLWSHRRWKHKRKHADC